MSRPLRRALGALLAVVGALALAALSRVPYTPAAAEQSVLRLSWRAPGVRVQNCRRLTDEEKAALPAHMRRDEVCEGRLLPAHLRVEVDGRVVVDDTVRASGARGDRPLYVFREIPLAPGAHALRVRFTRPDGGSGAAAPPLELLDTIAPGAGEVALVTYDADAGALVVRTPGPGPGAVHPRLP